MPNDNAIKLGILKCRDLVELYYGARMVVDIREKEVTFTASTNFTLLPPDPRRIRYELIFANGGNAPQGIEVSTPRAADNVNEQFYTIGVQETLIIQRDFLTDLDAVCLELVGNISDTGVFASTRETFLTPAPVDEMP